MEPHLKLEQHYIDLYDRQTVKLCRELEEIGLRTEVPTLDGKPTTPEQQQRAQVAFNELHLYFVQGERYQKKSETVRQWMELDRERDALLETASAPENITCSTCGRLMFVSSKHFSFGDKARGDRILFFYDCPLEHIPRRALYSDGVEFKREKPQCPKCRAELTEEDRTTEEKFITYVSCSACGYTATDEVERLANKEETPNANFEKDRQRFCSEETGQKYVDWMRTAHELEAILNKEKEKEKQKDLYDAVAKLKKLKINELEELLAPALEKEKFIKFHFKDPEITRDVTVPFIVYDGKEGRENHASCLDLQKLLKKTLEATNWRLMTDGVNYRLGMLEGRLRAYEREEDLIGLFKNKK